MDPFEPDRLSDAELDRILARWEAPEPPDRLRAALFPEAAQPWWRRIWRVSIRIPIPVAVMLVLAAALAIWRWPASPAPTSGPPVVRTERVEVPVIQERVVTRNVYVDRAAAPLPDADKLRPVAELRPVIIRRENVPH